MQRGFALIEIVFAAAIVSLSLTGVLSVAQQSLRLSEFSLREAQAAFLLDEGAEAVRGMRDVQWTNISGLSTSTTYYLSFQSGANAGFATTTTNTYLDGIFERSVRVAEVYRDGNDRIASSGTLDTGTRKVRVEVSWQNRGATTTRAVELYLSNI